MPGVVEKMLVSEGQKVATGDILCTISAMKMEVKNIMYFFSFLSYYGIIADQ